jgi:hypothetical protein
MGHIRRRLELGETQCFQQDANGVLWLKDRLVVPKDLRPHRKIMDKAHCSRYSIHSGTNKMYQDLKKKFWWTRMKQEIAKYVSESDTCRRVKADHLRPAGNLQPLSIPEWKWEKNLYGLHCGFAPHLTWVQLNMGHYGSPDEVRLLYTHIHHLQGQAVSRVIYATHRPRSWHTEDHYF